MENDNLLKFFLERCCFDHIHANRYYQLFTSQFITELELPDLSHELLKEIGVTAIGHRMRILKYSKSYQNITPSINNTITNIPIVSTDYTIQNQLQNEIITKQNTLNELKNNDKTDNLSIINSNKSIIQETNKKEDKTNKENNEKEKKEEKEEKENMDLDNNINTININKTNQSSTLNHKKLREITNEFDSDNESDDEVYYSPNINKKYKGFEGLVRINNLISSRSDKKLSKPFITSINHPEFKKQLKRYLTNTFMICQVPPRSHQLKCLELLITDLLKRKNNEKREQKKPLNYLLQHSIGSGKSLVIAALVYLLTTIKDSNSHLFDIILVVNDRKQLDMQLWLTVSRFLSTHGIDINSNACRPSSSTELQEILLKRTKDYDKINPFIIFSTLQKFIKISHIGNDIIIPYKIAIIADEAHRSHGKRTTRLIHDFMIGQTRQNMNITYFSFTSTPTSRALEMFGVKVGNTIEPFHTYSISEAIRDGHICNPIENYSSISTKAEIISKDPDTTLHKSNISLSIQHITRAASSSIELLHARAKYIVHHYITEIYHKKKTIHFNPKAMLVANSRLSIIRYKEIIDSIIKDLKEDDKFEVVVAFTPFQYNGKTYYEEDINTKYGVNFLQEFQKPSSKTQMLIVHSKFLIGFDEPLLHTMYIDRILQGTALVQALGRLCRVAPGKKDTCVVDFVNPRTSIANIFGIYWNKTSMKVFSNYKSDKEKFKRLEDTLKNYTCIRNNYSVNECIDYLKRESSFNNKILSDIIRSIGLYELYCDRLQIEAPDLNLTLLRDIKIQLSAFNNNVSQNFINKCKTAMEVRVSDISSIASGTIQPSKPKPIKQRKLASKKNKIPRKSDLVSVPQLINSVSQNFTSKQLHLSSSILPTDKGPEIQKIQGMSPEILTFAKGLLRKSHEIDENKDNLKQSKDVDSSPELEGSLNITKLLEKKAKNSNSIDNNSKNSNSTTNSIEKIPSPLLLPSPRLSLSSDKSVIVPRIVEITKAFNSLLDIHTDEAKQGLEILKKHVELGDNKVELQSMDLIPKILTYIKGLCIQNNTSVLCLALEILTIFCDCIRDIEALLEYSIIQQINRLLRSESINLAVQSSKLLIKMINIGQELCTPTIATTDIIPSLRLHINNPHADISEIQDFLRVIRKLGEDTICLQTIHKTGLISTLCEIIKIEGAETSSMAADAVQVFAETNHSIRIKLRNDRRLKEDLGEILKKSSKEKSEGIQKLMRYIWGYRTQTYSRNYDNRTQNTGYNIPHSSTIGIKRTRLESEISLHNEEPPRKIRNSPKIKSQHTIQYKKQSNRRKL